MEKNNFVRKAVIPAAGLGTRFLPLTKAMPKEMLPVVDKPVIQYVVEEAILSGIDDILIITGKNKRAIEDHFDTCFELEYRLKQKNNNKLLLKIQELSNMVDIHYIRQKEQSGLGNAILYAERHCNEEPFAVLLGDTITFPHTTNLQCTQQLINMYNTYRKSVIAIESVATEKVQNYGIIDGLKFDQNKYFIKHIIEKPNIESAPSNLGAIGRYILTPDIFDIIKTCAPGCDGEIQLTDAINKLHDIPIGLITNCTRYDIGNKVDWMKANIELSLQCDEFAVELATFLKTIIYNGSVI